MKKNYFVIAAMAVCLSLLVVFTSCGSDSDDEQEVITPTNSIMKMELSLSGDYAKFNPYLAFHAWDLKGKGMAMHTSTGQDVNMIWEQIYDNCPFAYGSAQIKGSYSSFSGTLSSWVRCPITLTNVSTKRFSMRRLWWIVTKSPLK